MDEEEYPSTHKRMRRGSFACCGVILWSHFVAVIYRGIKRLPREADLPRIGQNHSVKISV